MFILSDLKIGFLPLMRGLRASAPQIWYANLFAKPRGRYQHFRANSRMSYKVGNRHSSPPYEAPSQRLLPLGLHSLQRRRLRVDLITALKIFTGLLGLRRFELALITFASIFFIIQSVHKLENRKNELSKSGWFVHNLLKFSHFLNNVSFFILLWFYLRPT